MIFVMIPARVSEHEHDQNDNDQNEKKQNETDQNEKDQNEKDQNEKYQNEIDQNEMYQNEKDQSEMDRNETDQRDQTQKSVEEYEDETHDQRVQEPFFTYDSLLQQKQTQQDQEDGAQGRKDLDTNVPISSANDIVIEEKDDDEFDENAPNPSHFQKKKVAISKEVEEHEEELHLIVKISEALWSWVTSHLGLFVILVLYTLVGGAIMEVVENRYSGDPEACANFTEVANEITKITKKLQDHKEEDFDVYYMNKSMAALELVRAYGIGVKPREENVREVHAITEAQLVHFIKRYDQQKKWYKRCSQVPDYWKWVLYCLTVYTTIGYGSIHARTRPGRVVTMAYACIGVPLFFLTMGKMGKFATRTVKFIISKSRKIFYAIYAPLRRNERFRKLFRLPEQTEEEISGTKLKRRRYAKQTSIDSTVVKWSRLLERGNRSSGSSWGSSRQASVDHEGRQVARGGGAGARPSGSSWSSSRQMSREMALEMSSQMSRQMSLEMARQMSRQMSAEQEGRAVSQKGGSRPSGSSWSGSHQTSLEQSRPTAQRGGGSRWSASSWSGSRQTSLEQSRPTAQRGDSRWSASSWSRFRQMSRQNSKQEGRQQPQAGGSRWSDSSWRGLREMSRQNSQQEGRQQPQAGGSRLSASRQTSASQQEEPPETSQQDSARRPSDSPWFTRARTSLATLLRRRQQQLARDKAKQEDGDDLSYVSYTVDDEFNLHPLIAIAITVAYILLGSLMYVQWEEDWGYHDAFYFVFVSISTIGFGDVVPKHTKFFLLSSIYILFGLALVAMVIDVLIDFFTKTYEVAEEFMQSGYALEIQKDFRAGLAEIAEMLQIPDSQSEDEGK